MLKLKLLKYRNLVNKELKIFTRKYLENYSLAWDKKFVREINDFLINGGKRLRPVLATIIYDGMGGKNLVDFIKISLSAEILHASTLIHDDIIDESDMRRGRPSFHKRFENWFSENSISNAKKESESMAILAGDYLNFLSLQCVLDSNFPADKKLLTIQIIRNTSETVIKGQILDSELGTINATLEDYLRLIEMKTASVFEYSTRVATILAGAPSGVTNSLSKYAKNLGSAFQIQDDILGIFGKKKELGKPITTDLAEGKRTVLIIKAYEFADASQKRILDNIVGNKNITENDVERIMKILIDTGSLDYAKDLANDYIEESLNLLNPLKDTMKSDTFKILNKLPDLIVNRNY